MASTGTFLGLIFYAGMLGWGAKPGCWPGPPPIWRPYSAQLAFLHFAGRPIAATDPIPGMFELHRAGEPRSNAGPG